MVLLGVLLLAVCLGCVIFGQRTVGWLYLGLMLLGLCGILALLFIYNRSVEKPRHEEQDPSARPESKTAGDKP